MVIAARVSRRMVFAPRAVCTTASSSSNKTIKDPQMRYAVRLAALAVLAFAVSFAVPAHAQNNFTFAMVPTGGVEACILKAKGRVTITTLGVVENMHVEVSGLPGAT